MKIALVSPHYPPVRGGVSDYTKILETALLKIAQVVPFVKRPFSLKSASTVTAKIIEQKCDGVILQYTPNLFKWHNLFPFFFLRRLKAAGIKSMTVFHEIFMPEYPGIFRHMMERPFNYLKDLFCLKMTDYPVVTFHYRANAIQDKHAVKPFVLPVFSAIPCYQGPLLEKTHLMGTFGTLHHDVNLAGMLEAVNAFNEERVLCIGDIPKDIPASKRLDFTGYVPAHEVASLLQHIKFFIVYDKRGISLRKSSAAAALLNGIPVIANRTGWTDSLFKHGHNVYLFNGTVEGLVKAVRTLSADSALAEQIAQNGRALYLEYMAVEKIAGQMVDILGGGDS